MTELWPLTSTPDTEYAQTQNVNIVQLITVSSNFLAKSIGWYAKPGDGAQPSRLILWNTNTGAIIQQVTGFNPPTANGWWYVNLDPVTLVPGINYGIGLTNSNGGVNRAWATGSQGANAPFFAGQAFFADLGGGSSNAVPSTDAGQNRFAVSISDQTAPAGGGTPSGGGSSGTTTADLSEWFSSSSSVNTHQGDLPWRTDANVQTIKAETQSGTSGLAVIKSAIDAIAAAIGGPVGTIASMLVSISGQIATAVGNTAQSGIATIGAISHDLRDVEIALINGLFGRAPFPGGSSTATWTLAAEADFVQDVAINTPADLYVITFTTLPVGIGDIIVAGVHWHPRLAWCAELNGTHLAGRQFLDFENNQVWAQEHRLQGLLVHGKIGSAGHWQAWTLS